MPGATTSGSWPRPSKVFVAEGAEASLDEIAREAEVGIGTLYRHFPTRQCLLEAVFLDQVDDLRVWAQVLAADPVPIDALARWLRAHIQHGTTGPQPGFERHVRQAAGGVRGQPGVPVDAAKAARPS